jgi:hypothetical protein
VTKHFGGDGERTVTEGATNAAKLSFHGTITFSKVS